jgi:serpin B
LTSSQAATLRSFGAGDTAFGLNLLSALCRRQPGTNVLISPVSLATGLSMAYLGPRGATAAAMARVLHLPATQPGLLAGLRARRTLLASLNRPGVTFAESSRLWADPSLVTSRSYAAALRESYRAGVTRVPLLSAPSQARAQINRAVAAQTHGHISNLLPAGSIPPHSVGWVLTNALYLDAAWQHRFDPAKTAPGPFRTGNGTVVTVRYMHGGGYGYDGTASGWRATSLRYIGGRLAMLAVLPPASKPGRPGPARGCQVPGVTQLRTIMHGLAAPGVAAPGEGHQIALPTIRLASSEPLKGVLTGLGMGIAFSRRADFTGISPQAWRLGFVQHAATLSVAEKGVVASAATAVGVQPTALPVPLIFDRPYLLIIQDLLTGEPLMMAWVANPAKG